MKFVVAVTDDKWFEFLRHKPDLDEVNFWAPSTKTFCALEQYDFFLFKLRHPSNMIVGGGYFYMAHNVSCYRAWETFGEKNGAPSAQDMRKRIAKLRRSDPNDRSDFPIGCRILVAPFFFDESEWIPQPKDWSQNIVSYKTYDANTLVGKEILDAVEKRLQRRQPQDTQEEMKGRSGSQILIQARVGQGSFRALVTEIYRRRCAVTQERTLPALEAAHIRPYSIGGAHEASNGLLLRRDIHSLFDSGYVTVTPEHKFEVSKQIKEEFRNGHEYYELHGKLISVPEDVSQRPDRRALIWHNERCFKG